MLIVRYLRECTWRFDVISDLSQHSTKIAKFDFVLRNKPILRVWKWDCKEHSVKQSNRKSLVLRFDCVRWKERALSKQASKTTMNHYACTSTSVHSIDDIWKASREFLHLQKSYIWKKKMSKVFPEVSMYRKLYTKQPVLHTYSLLRTSHCNDLGVTLWMYAAGIYDEKLYRRCGGKLYKLIRLYPPRGSYYLIGSWTYFLCP